MNKHGEKDHADSGCLQYGCSYLSMACSAVLCGGGKKEMSMDTMTSEEIRAANPSFYNAKLIDKNVDADWGWVFASGGDELRARAKEEFINFAMVSALTLSITLPLLLSPPDLIDTDGNRTHWKYQVLAGLCGSSCAFSLTTIMLSVLLLKEINKVAGDVAIFKFIRTASPLMVKNALLYFLSLIMLTATVIYSMCVIYAGPIQYVLAGLFGLPLMLCLTVANPVLIKARANASTWQQEKWHSDEEITGFNPV